MGNKSNAKFWNRERLAALGIFVTGLLIIAVLLLGHRGENEMFAKKRQSIKKLRSEITNLRAKVAKYESDKPSFQFWDCTRAKKGGMWSMAIHHYTRGYISAWYCMGHKGDLKRYKTLPRGKEKYLTCREPKR